MVEPVLPYIVIKNRKGEFPFLIDTGANVSFINPEIAESCETAKPFEIPLKNIASASGKFQLKSAIDLNFFYPKINCICRFMLHSFHHFFVGIIGTDILYNLNASIDLEKRVLKLHNFSQILQIPLNFYTSSSQSSNSSFRLNHLNNFEQTKLKKVLDSNMSVFYEPKLKVTCTNDDIPIHQKVYPYPAAYTEEVNKQITELLDNGIIRPSHSAWTAPVWVVPKKSDASGEKKFRMVIDYRKLNQKTIVDRYPMPEINYVIDERNYATERTHSFYDARFSLWLLSNKNETE